MSQRKPRTRAEAKQAQATRSPSVRSGGSGGSGGSRSSASPGRSRGKKWLLRALWTVLALGALGLVAVGIAYARTDIPDANELATAQASIVYYSDGKTEMARLSDAQGNRESVPLSKVPDHMQKAMLAAEDQDFYQNNGISPTGIARAVLVAVKGGQATQGGSTITQQYVKNYFLTADRTLSRKAREILISIKIDQQQSKDEILENYLNTIYYGRGAYGIQTASKAYFNKDVSKLTPAESAFLASVIRGPSLYDPAPGRRAGGQRRGALGLHPRRDGREGLAQPGGARRRHLPEVPRVQAAHPERPHRLPHPDGQERGRQQVQDPPVRHRPRWAAHRLHRRQEQAGRHGQGGQGRAPREDPVGARRHGLDRARQRRHRRAVRRRGLSASASRTPPPRTRCRPARRSRSSR